MHIYRIIMNITVPWCNLYMLSISQKYSANIWTKICPNFANIHAWVQSLMCCLLIEAFACYVLEKVELYGPSVQNKNVTALRIELLSNESTIIAIFVNSKGNVTINSCNSAQYDSCTCRFLQLSSMDHLNMLRKWNQQTYCNTWPLLHSKPVVDLATVLKNRK